MKRKWNLWKLLAAGLAAALLFTGCGSSGSDGFSVNSSSSAAAGTEAAAPEEIMITGEMLDEDILEMETGAIEADVIENTSRKIVYTASVSIETESFDDSAAAIRRLVDEAGGYIAASYLWNSSSGMRRTTYSCRVPVEQYAAFMESLSGTGNVYRVDQSTEDVTTQYVDIEARLNALEAQRDRLSELADEAADIETLLAIETERSYVQYELESYTAQMRTLQNQISYSTVDIELGEVVSVSEGTSFGTRVKAAFGGSWDNFVAAVQGIIIALIYLLPGLIVLGIVLAAVIPLIVRHSRKAKARAAAQPPGRYSGWNQSSPPVPEETKPAPPQDAQEKG